MENQELNLNSRIAKKKDKIFKIRADHNTEQINIDLEEWKMKAQVSVNLQIELNDCH